MAFEKGKSGNPKGRPRRIDTAAEKARPHVDKAIAVLIAQLSSGDERIAQRAAEILIERGYGKPTEFVEIESDNHHTGELEHRGLPNLMGGIASDLLRRRARDNLQVSSEDKSILSVEVYPKPE